MIRSIRTYDETWLNRHRETHRRHPEFGTHRHPYLLDQIRDIAVRMSGPEKPSLLDYGCGKGVFLREMERSGLFRYVRGHDPAVEAFCTRPTQMYDLVLCLDVLDQIGDEFVEAMVEDVAQLTGRIALFDVITVQTPALAHLNPRSAQTWREIIGRHMPLSGFAVRSATPDEIAAGSCPERVIILAEPVAAASR